MMIEEKLIQRKSWQLYL